MGLTTICTLFLLAFTAGSGSLIQGQNFVVDFAAQKVAAAIGAVTIAGENMVSLVAGIGGVSLAPSTSGVYSVGHPTHDLLHFSLLADDISGDSCFSGGDLTVWMGSRVADVTITQPSSQIFEGHTLRIMYAARLLSSLVLAPIFYLFIFVRNRRGQHGNAGSGGGSGGSIEIRGGEGAMYSCVNATAATGGQVKISGGVGRSGAGGGSVILAGGVGSSTGDVHVMGRVFDVQWSGGSNQTVFLVLYC